LKEYYDVVCSKCGLRTDFDTNGLSLCCRSMGKRLTPLSKDWRLINNVLFDLNELFSIDVKMDAPRKFRNTHVRVIGTSKTGQTIQLGVVTHTDDETIETCLERAMIVRDVVLHKLGLKEIAK
jgi:hypothetical protein